MAHSEQEQTLIYPDTGIYPAQGALTYNFSPTFICLRKFTFISFLSLFFNVLLASSCEMCLCYICKCYDEGTYPRLKVKESRRQSCHSITIQCVRDIKINMTVNWPQGRCAHAIASDAGLNALIDVMIL